MVNEQDNLQQELDQFDQRLQHNGAGQPEGAGGQPKLMGSPENGNIPITTMKSTTQDLNQVEEQSNDDDDVDDENQYYKDQFDSFCDEEQGDDQEQASGVKNPR